MKALERRSSYESFFHELGSAPARVLLLDYDGTLAPFTADRAGAFPYPGIPELVVRIMSGGTRVVLISGRAARELILLSGIHPHPEIWGSHGLERLKGDGSYEMRGVPRGQQAGLSLAVGTLRNAGFEREIIEVKPAGVAVHWRGLSFDRAQEIEETARQLWQPLVDEYSLSILEFEEGIELRIAGVSKADAVDEILRESHPGALFAYLGDDRTDEQAFRRLLGKGLTVLVRPSHRETAADVWLQPPQGVMQFLEDWLRASGDGP